MCICFLKEERLICEISMRLAIIKSAKLALKILSMITPRVIFKHSINEGDK